MKRVTRHILFLFVVSLLITGCGNDELDKSEQASQLVQQLIQETEKAIKDKDEKLVREIWSQISEYGVKAKDLDKEELADSLGELAATYAKLVEYIQTGDKKSLDNFKQELSTALNKVQKILDKEIE